MWSVAESGSPPPGGAIAGSVIFFGPFLGGPRNWTVTSLVLFGTSQGVRCCGGICAAAGAFMLKWQLPGALVVVLLVVFGARAQSPAVEPHFSSSSLSAICRGSAFIHGYLHGYEDAFHTANLRLYMPGFIFNPPKLDNGDEKAYRAGFGDRQFFRSGYRYGFLSGYAEGISGRSFRALELIRDSLDAFPVLGSAAGTDGLDRGLSVGYLAGRERGLHDGRLREPFQPPGNACDPGQEGSEAPGFCKGLEQGYRMGYTDGYQNQYTRPAAQTASR